MAKKLAQLYHDAQCSFYGPIIDQLERDGKIGPEGMTEEAAAALPPFMDIETFQEHLDKRGIPYRL